MKKIILLLIFLTLPGLSAAQSRTNLEVFYSLIDSSINLFPREIKPLTVSVYSGNNILLYNYIFNRIADKYPGIKDSAKADLSYAVEDVKLTYGDIFRKKFLGDYYVERNFLLKGNWLAPGETLHRDFSLSVTDTIKYDDLKDVENSLHPFTKAELPGEPFLQGIIEPVVAVGTAAAAVILFFVLRSK